MPGEKQSIELYQHEGHQLLPILEWYFPKSLPVYGAISTLLDLSPDSIGSSSSNLFPAHNPLSTYSTFPPDTPPPPLFTVLVPLPPPQTSQIRLFCSAELDPSLDSQRRAAAQAQVEAALEAYAVLHPEVRMVGALNTLWEEGVRDLLGAKARGVCGVWVPPKGQEGAWGRMEKEGRREGYEVDIGREVDIEQYQETSDIHRPYEYYQARLPLSTVIRPMTNPGQSPRRAASMILTHADGSLGALHTAFEHRRMGLARWVTLAHLASGRGGGWAPNATLGASGKQDRASVPSISGFKPDEGADEMANANAIVPARDRSKRPAWAVVFRRNEASNALWSGLGWEMKWECAWTTAVHEHEERGGASRRDIKALLDAVTAALGDAPGGR